MANWYGAARSNYVRVADMEGLIKSLAPWPIEIAASTDPAVVCFLSQEMDSGGWPGFAEIEVPDPESEDLLLQEIEFDPATQILPFLAEGEVLVTMEAGAEKLRYITGTAVAYCMGKEPVALSLDDIYDLAKKAFGVADVSRVAY